MRRRTTWLSEKEIKMLMTSSMRLSTNRSQVSTNQIPENNSIYYVHLIETNTLPHQGRTRLFRYDLLSYQTRLGGNGRRKWSL